MFRKPKGSRVLSLAADKVRVFDDNTTIQFHKSAVLARFRKRARAVLAAPVDSLLAKYPRGSVKSLLPDPSKSRGKKVFGSIARAAYRSDKNNDSQQEMKLRPPVIFKFNRVHLVTSNGWLTNPRKKSLEDYLIPED